MSRAAVLVGGPDPFLDAEWLRNYATWEAEVDRLYVIICGQQDRALRAYIQAKVDALGGTLVEFAPALDHGVAIKRALSAVTEDVVMLCEEDAFVRDPGKVRESFERIERNEVDVVACPRGTGTPDVIALGNNRFGELVASTGECGPIFWPCFLFARRTDLERIDNYSVWGAKAGESFLGHGFSEDQAMDTFGYASLMLRENGARVHTEPNYRADLAKMDDWGLSPWFHVGSMSTGYGMYICGPGAHKAGLWQHLRGSDLNDWCKRVAFWEILGERAEDLDGRRAEYAESVAELAREVGMDRGAINDWKAKFQRLINW